MPPHFQGFPPRPLTENSPTLIIEKHPHHVETYRSGHNGAHSKCVSRFPARGFESLRLRQIS